jgi:hypothetical protein
MLASILVTVTSPALVHAAPETQERILVIGDSQAQGLAGGIQRLYRADHNRRVIDHSKISTGLMPRANYDWPAQAKIIAGEEHYDLAIMLIGANDRPPVHVGGRVDPALLARFTESYGQRVADIAEDFKRVNVPLIWVGHPIVRDAVWNEDVTILNAIFAARSVEQGATFLSTADMFKGPDGNYAQYGKGLDGMTTRLRADDGVHLLPAGYDLVTAALVPALDHFRPVAPVGATAANL